jgi:outer membrane protein assembly factor BamB
VGGGLVVAAFSRGADGIVAWDAMSGAEAWRVPRPLSTAILASVVVGDQVMYLGNSETEVFALDMSPRAPSYATWTNKLTDSAGDWSYGIVATPALAAGRLIVPTMTGDVVAVNASSGSEAWRFSGGASMIRPSAGAGSGAAAFAVAPVVTNDIVWVGGADGRLSALDLESGDELWTMDFGVPIMSAPVPSGDLLFVGTFDGTLHALRAGLGPTCPTAPGCKQPSSGGCAIAVARHRSWLGSGVLFLLALAAVALRRRR